ncbi:NAD-dependent epimerase/dehydratase family protein [Paenibacillus macerans]|uniref:NAD-dependent epimerase/dehydratase family protein n=1 Tax=Paenibacillus macerans TaxID=44252 RepID=UPI003D3152F0
MKTVAITGGSGKLGEQVVRELLQQGRQVISLDRQRSGKLPCKQFQVDLADLGQVISALEGAEAIVHLAAIPAPLWYPAASIFANNAVSTYHVLEAASLLGIRRVVLGSSESSYGFAWSPLPFAPDFVPVTEEHPQLPQECYGLSKVVGELTAEMFHRRSGIEAYSLRFSTIIGRGEYERIDLKHPEKYKKTLWSYIDIRDAVSACLTALEQDGGGSHSLNITADDTLSELPTETLLELFYPDSIRTQKFTGREALVSNGLAKQILNWEPRYSCLIES